MNSKRFPLICLLESPYGHYFYDANKHDIVQISEELYKRLSDWKIRNNAFDENEYDSEINELIAEGFLSDNRVEVIEHPETQYLNVYQRRNISNITLQVTQQCNLRCSYCVYSISKNEKQRNHTDSVMDIKTAKKVIDFLCKHSIDAKILDIGFEYLD